MGAELKVVHRERDPKKLGLTLILCHEHSEDLAFTGPKF